MNTIFTKVLPEDRVKRCARLLPFHLCCIAPVTLCMAVRRRAKAAEIFDEFEEWHLMSSHYCVVVAVKDAAAAGTADPPPSAGDTAGAGVGAGAGVAADAGAGAGAGAGIAPSAGSLFSLLFDKTPPASP